MARNWKQRRADRQRAEQERQRAEFRAQQLTEEAVVRTEKVEQRIQKFAFLLQAALSRPVEPLDFEQMKKSAPMVDLGADAEPLPLPRWEEYAPAPVNPLQKLLHRGRFRQPTEAEAEEAYAKALERYRSEEAARQRRIEERQQSHLAAHAAEVQAALDHNRSVDEFRDRVFAGDQQAVSDYFTRAMEPIVDRAPFPRGRRMAYVPESRLLVIEWQVPSIEIIPREKEYRYDRSTGSISVHKWRPMVEVREIYDRLLAQLGLRATYVAFGVDPAELVDTVIVNGVVESADDPAPCLFTMSISRRHFNRINLEDVADPLDLVRRHCGADFSPFPEEHAAIAPILPYALADPGVVSAPPTRAPNLDTVPFDDFQRVMERLLDRMGYSVEPLPHAPGSYLASQVVAGQPQRCVVHVRRGPGRLDTAEVRGLASAVRREHADSGMLLTTSGLDPQAFEYAHGRPLRLYDGHSLIALCHQHDLPARIEPLTRDDPRTVGPQQVPEQRRDWIAARVHR